MIKAGPSTGSSVPAPSPTVRDEMSRASKMIRFPEKSGFLKPSTPPKKNVRDEMTRASKMISFPEKSGFLKPSTPPTQTVRDLMDPAAKKLRYPETSAGFLTPSAQPEPTVRDLMSRDETKLKYEESDVNTAFDPNATSSSEDSNFSKVYGTADRKARGMDTDELNQKRKDAQKKRRKRKKKKEKMKKKGFGIKDAAAHFFQQAGRGAFSYWPLLHVIRGFIENCRTSRQA